MDVGDVQGGGAAPRALGERETERALGERVCSSEPPRSAPAPWWWTRTREEGRVTWVVSGTATGSRLKALRPYGERDGERLRVAYGSGRAPTARGDGEGLPSSKDGERRME